jgi:hypothetical protein
MHKPTFINESVLPLEVLGYEANYAVDVFVLTRALDGNLALSMEANGYVQRSNIELSNGRIVDGWVKV